MFNKSALFNRKDPIPQREIGFSDPSNPANKGSGSASGKPFVRTTTNPVKESENPVKTEETSPSAATSTAASAVPSKENTIPETTQEKKEGSRSTVADAEIGARLVVGPDVKLKGAQILDCDMLVVEGYVEATMDSRVIQIAEHGSFNGKVSVDVAEIRGTFEGELTARLQLIIHSTARVKGSIRYGKLVADEGCELRGDVDVLSRTDKSDSPAVSAI